jgi:hypothetical protein
MITAALIAIWPLLALGYTAIFVITKGKMDV